MQLAIKISFTVLKIDVAGKYSKYNGLTALFSQFNHCDQTVILVSHDCYKPSVDSGDFKSFLTGVNP
jgi:hypothetical protein